MALYNEETKIRDLYSILNIPKNATQEEIKNAYKRMCIIYHPDKQLNESLLHNSVKKFNEIKSAYNILSDNRKRAIYDLYGVVDESTGKEVVVFNKYNTEDHKLDYLKRIYEKELIDQFCLSNPKSLAKIVLDVSPLFDQHFTYDSFLEKVLAIKCASFMLLNSVELPIYKENNVSFFCSLNTDNGYGSGQLIVSYHHKSNETLWHKADIIISNGLHFILDTHKKITDRLVLSFGIINLLNQEYFAFAFKPSISFKISDKINTSITWQTALPSTITKTIHFRSHSTKIDVKINFSILNSYLSINNSYLYSDKLRLFNKNKLSYNGFNQAVGFHYVFNKFSSCSAFFNFGTFGSIYFDLRIQRTGKVFSVPIILSDEFQLNSFFYGIFIFPATIYLIKRYLVDWISNKHQFENNKKNAEKTAWVIEENRLEAELCIKLMKDAYNRIVEIESSKNGLIISIAYYGAGVDDFDKNDTWQKINVKIPLQCLVTDSKLILSSGTKSNLNGFYDPFPNTEKYLMVEYLFRSKLHRTVVFDKDPLAIPKLSHML